MTKIIHLIPPSTSHSSAEGAPSPVSLAATPYEMSDWLRPETAPRMPPIRRKRKPRSALGALGAI